MPTAEAQPHDGELYIRSLMINVTLAEVYYKLWQPAVKEVEPRTGYRDAEISRIRGRFSTSASGLRRRTPRLRRG